MPGVVVYFFVAFRESMVGKVGEMGDGRRPTASDLDFGTSTARTSSEPEPLTAHRCGRAGTG